MTDIDSSFSIDEEDSQFELPSQNDQSQMKMNQAISLLPSLQQKVQGLALYDNYKQMLQLDQKKEDEIARITDQYEQDRQILLSKINQIVNGEIELMESDFEGVKHIFEKNQLDHIHQHFKIGKTQGFWSKVIQNDFLADEFLQQHDLPILKHLVNIKVVKKAKRVARNIYKEVLILKFYFEPNDYFSNRVIVQKIKILDSEVILSKGDKIHWKQGRDVTIRKLSPNSENYEKQRSFFNFFDKIESDQIQEEEEQQLQRKFGFFSLDEQYDFADSLLNQISRCPLQSYLGLDKPQIHQIVEKQQQKDSYGSQDQMELQKQINSDNYLEKNRQIRQKKSSSKKPQQESLKKEIYEEPKQQSKEKPKEQEKKQTEDQQKEKLEKDLKENLNLNQLPQQQPKQQPKQQVKLASQRKSIGQLVRDSEQRPQCLQQ